MADLFSVIPGIQPTSQEIIEAELLTKQILEARFPDIDLREGTGLRDTLLRPGATLLAIIKKSMDFYFTQNTLNGINNVTPPDTVDGILSNWFLTRNIGTKSVINARLYFARPKNIAISSDTYFSTDNISKFYPLESAAFASNALTFDSFSNEYYLDIDLIAESEGTQYNLGSGSLLYFANFDPYFLHAEINYLKQESIDSETNLEFISRAKNSISTRNLINVPSIDSNLRANFNYIKRLTSIGYGDDEMIRDQLKAVFEDQPLRALTSLTSSGTLATATLANHGYNTGQVVKISNVTPSTYNGTYTITVLSTSTFTYTMATTASIISTIPYVTMVNDPVLIHNGGTVDIYASDSISSAVVQITLNEFGIGQITGPVYSFKRSALSGGDLDDTVPLNNVSAVSGIVVSGTTATVTTAAPHNFISSDIVTITGAVQSQSITSLTCTGTTVTATKSSHGYIVGNTVVISGAIPSAYNGTYTIASATTNTFTYTVSTSIGTSPATGIILAKVDLLNGPHSLTSVSTSSFTFTLSQSSALTVTGTISSSSPTRYNTTNLYAESKTVTSISSVGTLATVTLTKHGYSVGRYITISGSSPSGYNGTWRIKEILNLDQFTFDLPSTVGGSSTVGSVAFITPWYDYGFSQKQVLTVDFGVANANRTASFEIDYFQNLNSIQTYLDLPLNRVLCADYLARGFNFYYLSVDITSYNSTAPSVDLATKVINDYISNLSTGDMFVMSDMVSKLRLNGIVNIKSPPVVTYKLYTRDLNPVISGTITDVLDPNDRTCVFLLESVTTQTENISTKDPVIL